MKTRIYVSLLTISLISVICHSSVLAASIPYKKKIQIDPFRNPPGWIGTYSPGELISDLLKQKLRDQENVTLVDFMLKGSQDKKEKTDHASPAQIIISGKIMDYRPALPISLESTKREKKISRSAKVQIEVKIFQGQTKRLVSGFVLNQNSNDGEFPLGYSQSSLSLRSPDFRKTFMGRALDQITDKIIPEIEDYLDQAPLDGQVIAVEQEEEQMIINVGQRSGVEIRDEFIVYSVDVNFPDPLYQEDIGDRLTKLGVVRVINVQEGFSEAVIMAGGDFVKGNLVRSKKFKPRIKILNRGSLSVR